RPRSTELSRLAGANGYLDFRLSDPLWSSWELSYPSTKRRVELDRPQRVVAHVLQRHGHHFGCAVDRDVTEELQAVGRSGERDALRQRLHVDDLRAERVVDLVLAAGSGVDRAGYEFAERCKVLEHRLVRIEIVRGGIMHVGGEPERVADAGVLDEGEEVGDLQFTAARRPVALRDRFAAPLAIRVVDTDQ